MRLERYAGCGQCERLKLLKGPLTEDQRYALRWALSLTLICITILVVTALRFSSHPLQSKDEETNLLAWILLVTLVLSVWLSWEAITFIRCNLIGWTYYCFLDHLGQSHIHRKRPDIELPPGAVGTMRGLSTAFQVRSGGWFRRNRVLSAWYQTWRIDRAWDRLEDIRIRDGFRGELAGVGLERLLGVVTQFNYMSGLIAHVHEANAIAEHLGCTNARLIHRILRERATMGRSEHARAAREALEAAFATELPGLQDRVDRWRAAAIAEAVTAASSAG